jgi:LysM repeat protein
VEIAARTVYTVQPGDSLWSIAQRVQSSADPRPLVAELAKETGSNSVVPGERIAIP